MAKRSLLSRCPSYLSLGFQNETGYPFKLAQESVAVHKFLLL